jgi:hypothetical protein
MEKDNKLLLSDKLKENSTPSKNMRNSSGSKRLTSGSKKRFSDRFIPSSISKNLLGEFSSESVSNTSTSPFTHNNISSKSLNLNKKSDANYQKIIQSEILEESTPSII